MEQTKRPASTVFLLCLSSIALVLSFAAYSLSDVHNTYDFLAPVIGILQFIFILSLFKGKFWGLISYTINCIGALAAVVIYALSKGKIGQWVVPITFLSLLCLLSVNYWTNQRSYFK